MGRPDTTPERAGAPLWVVLATGYGTAALVMPMVVVEWPGTARSWVMLVAAEAMAVLCAVVWARWGADPSGARRSPLGRAVAVAVGPVVVAVAALLFTVTPDGFATVILATLLGAGVGLAVGPVRGAAGARPAPAGARPAARAAAWVAVWASAAVVLVAVARWSQSSAWVLAIGLTAVAAWSRRAPRFDEAPAVGVRRARLLRTTALCGAAGLLAWTGANDPQLSWFGPVVYHGPDGSRDVALTFDDGPNGQFSLDVARILDQRGYKGTFFLVGKALDRQPQVARTLLADGQLLGGHSYHHDYWRWLDPRYPELARTNDSFRRALGLCPRFYRPPHGQRTPFVSAAVAMDDMTTVMWDVSGGDWITNDPRELARRILRRVQPGSIVLLHDGLDGNVGADRQVVLDALPLILDGLAKRGLTPVTVDRMTGGPAYRKGC